MKRICFYIADIGSGGGTERATTEIANYLVQAGYNVLILSEHKGRKSHFDLDKRISVCSLQADREKNRLKKKINVCVNLYKFSKTQHIDIWINVDVIRCNETLPIRWLLGGKQIAWEHFNHRTNNGVPKRDFARRLAARFADRIVVLTEADKKEYLDNHKDICPITTIHNPAKQVFPTNTWRKNVILAVGRLTYQKNYFDMLEIWAMISDQVSDYILEIVGDGEEREELQKKAEDLHLKNVRFEGFQRNVENYYLRSKVLIMTSRYEGLPMVMLEAISYGVPLISYDTFTGPADIIEDGLCGYLVPYGDQNAFAEKLLYFIKNEVVQKDMSKAALERSKDYSIDIIGKKWENLLMSL